VLSFPQAGSTAGFRNSAPFGPVTENSSIYGVQQIRRFPCLKKKAEPASKTRCFIKKTGQIPKKDYYFSQIKPSWDFTRLKCY